MNTSGSPLASVIVTALDAETFNFGGSVRSDASGRYVIPGLAPRPHYVRTSDEQSQHQNEVWNDIPCDNNGCPWVRATPVAVTAGKTTENIDFRLEPRGTVRVRVTNAITGLALDLVSVSVHTSTGVIQGLGSTGSDGIYQGKVDPGIYFVKVSGSTAYVDQVYGLPPCLDDASCDPLNGTPVTVASGATVSGIEIAVHPGGIIGGRVTDAVSGTALWGVRVVAWNSATGNTYEVTTSTGDYVIRRLPPGRYSVAALPLPDGSVSQIYNGRTCVKADCSTDTGDPVDVTFDVLTPHIDFALLRRGGLTGVVRDGVTGLPVSTASIIVRDATGATARTTASGLDGTYGVEGLPTGS